MTFVKKTPGIFLFFGLLVGQICYAQEFEVKRIDATRVKFEGRIGSVSAHVLLNTLKPDVKELIIYSPGGDASYAAVIGSYINEHQIAIVVDGLCASACANYVFLASPKKTLLTGSVLGFHGSLLSKKNEQQLQELRLRPLPDQAKLDQVRADHLDDIKNVFLDNERLELQILDKVNLNNAFLSISIPY